MTRRSTPAGALAVLLALVPMVDTPAAAQEPALVVFASGRTGDGDLYAVPLSGGTPEPWHASEHPEGTPRLDAARQRVVHLAYRGDTAFVMHRGAELFRAPGDDGAPVWSPDGDWIAYSRREGDFEHIVLRAVAGGPERRVTAGPVTDRGPAWSPDGSALVFARRDTTGWAIHTLDLHAPGAAPHRRTTPGRYVGHPAWSPDGHAIAFDLIVDGQSEVAILDLDTGVVRQLTCRAGNDLVPAWSPDGRWIVFAADSAGAGNWDIWRVEARGGRPVRLTRDPAFDGGPIVIPGADGYRP